MKFRTDVPPNNKETEGIPSQPVDLTFDPDREFFAFQSLEQGSEHFEYLNYETETETEEDKKDKEILFSNIRAAKEKGEKFDIEDIDNLKLEKIDPYKYLMAEFFLKKKRDVLNDEMIKEYEEAVRDRKQMEKIYLENYSNNNELKDKLVERFNVFMGKPSEKYKFVPNESAFAEVHLLKYKGKVIAFNRLDDKFWNKLYFQFFNVDKDAQGSGIGQMMCKATLDKKVEEGFSILADCITSKPISSFYIENGFIGRRMSEMYGESIMSIIRDDKNVPHEFKTKNLSKEEILEGANLPQGTIVNRSPTQESCDFKYIVPENYTRKEDLLPYHKALEKYVLTRYFFDKNTKEWITVFEPVTRELNDFL